MGQRLVISIEKDEKALAKIYYHWSAYSYSALKEAKDVINCIYNHEDETEKELLLRLIKFCEKRGGGIKGDVSEFEYIQKMYPNETFNTDGYSRSYGLIALSENGMKDLQDWSEGDITINLDEDMVYNWVYCYYDDFEEYKKERMEWDEDFDENMKLEDVDEIQYNLDQFSVDDIDYVINELDNADEFLVRNGYDIYELIA